MVCCVGLVCARILWHSPPSRSSVIVYTEHLILTYSDYTQSHKFLGMNPDQWDPNKFPKLYQSECWSEIVVKLYSNFLFKHFKGRHKAHNTHSSPQEPIWSHHTNTSYSRWGMRQGYKLESKQYQKDTKIHQNRCFWFLWCPLWPLNCICTHSEAHNRLARNTSSHESGP